MKSNLISRRVYTWLDKMKQKIIIIGLFLLGSPQAVFAHENYVLSEVQINSGMRDWSINVFNALQDPVNVRLSLIIGSLITLAIILYYYFEKSRAGLWLNEKLQNLEPLGHVLLRVALAASFLASALTYSYLGPEISVYSLPLGNIIHIALYTVGFMLLFGLFTEIAAVVSLLIIILATFVYKDYILTYFNYYGEFIALILFGSTVFSLDRYFFGKASRWREKYKQWEIAIIRITYGISILYPAISIKLLHPTIIIQIVEQYHLTKFHWLFPSDPLLISLGGGLLQVLLGIFLIVGFATRFSALATFILMLLSVIYFKEAVWPHYILLALALYLMINNGGELSLDHKIMKKTRLSKIRME
jgi:uncharacterized membrane protein YphA (DoxX/SURF4 family)